MKILPLLRGIRFPGLFILLMTGFLVLLLASAGAEGRTWYVDDDGGQDFETIQEAVNAAEDGDVIRVYEGLYQENVVLNRSLELVGNGSASSTIKGDGRSSVIWLDWGGCVVEGFNITGGGEDNNGAGIAVSSADNAILNSSIQNNEGSGIYLSRHESIRIEGNLLYDNGESGVSGLYTDSVVITDNRIFCNGESGIAFSYGDSFEISGNIIQENWRYGIHLSFPEDLVISHNRVHLNEKLGISLSHAAHAVICSNNASGNLNAGIGISMSDFVIIEGNYLREDRGRGVVLSNSDDSEIVGNVLEGEGGSAISVLWSSRVDVSANRVQNASVAGIFVQHVDHATLLDNEVLGVRDSGISLDDVLEVQLENNIIRNNSYGVSSEYAEKCRLFNNTLTDNRVMGLDVGPNDAPLDARGNHWGHSSGPYHPQRNPEGQGDQVSDNVLFDPWPEKPKRVHNQDRGISYSSIQEAIDRAWKGETIRVHAGFFNEDVTLGHQIELIGNGSANTTIFGSGSGDPLRIVEEGCSVKGFRVKGGGADSWDAGIKIKAGNTRISDVRVEDNLYNGLFIENCGSSVIQNVSCSGNQAYGIQLANVSSVTIVDSSCSDNGLVDIYLQDSVAISLHGNQMTGGGVLVSGPESAHWNTHSIPTNNTVNAEVIRYVVNQSLNLVPTSGGQLIVASCSNLDLVGLRLSGVSAGLQAGHSSNLHISDVWCNDTTLYGIYLESCEAPELRDLHCQGVGDTAIYLFNCSQAILRNSDCLDNQGYGIWLRNTDDSSIQDVNSSDNRFDGIRLLDCQDNFIYRVNCHDNQRDGIRVFNSTNTDIRFSFCQNNANYGIYFYQGLQNIVEDVDSPGNGLSGIHFAYSPKGRLINVSCEENREHGIHLGFSPDSSIFRANSSHNLLTGIWLENSDSCIVESSQIKDNGRDGIFCNDSGHCDIRDNLCFDNARRGLCLKGPGANAVTGNSFTWNECGIYIANHSEGNLIQNNLIANNSEYGIQLWNPGSPLTVNATGNWWGSSFGPFHPEKNPGGKGNQVSDNVEFTPWLADAEGPPAEDPVFEFYVNGKAPGGGDGSEASPFNSIQVAINAARDGMTINVLPGDYRESVFVNRSILLRGAGSGSVSILWDGVRAAAVTVDAENVTLSGFSVKDASYGVLITGHRAELEDIHSTNCQTGILIQEADYVSVSDSFCEENRGAGLKIQDTHHSTLTRLVCSSNLDSGIEIGWGSLHLIQDCVLQGNQNGLLFNEQSTGNCVVEDCEIFDNKDCGVSIDRGGNIQFTDNVISGNRVGIFQGQHARYNQLHSNEISGNSELAVQVEDASKSNPLNATENWWGDASGPYHPDTNPSGLGGEVSDKVVFDPWTGKLEETPTTFYVHLWSSDGDGSLSRPFGTIQEAVDAAESGNTIVVWGGTYSESVQIDKSLNLVGEGAEGCVILGGSLAVDNAITVNADHVNISGFSIQASGGSGVFVYPGNFVAIFGCQFKDNTVGVYLQGVDPDIDGPNGGYTADILIQNCIFLDNDEAGISVWGCDEVIIRNCQFLGDKGFGIENDVTWGNQEEPCGSEVIARNNYWGSNSGPSHVGLNPGGKGARVSGNVDFRPWLYKNGSVNEASATEPPQEQQGEPDQSSSSEGEFTGFHYLVLVVVLLFASSLAFSEALRFHFLKPFLPLYTRLNGDDIEEDIREQNIRGLIYQFIQDNPGAGFSVIKRELSVGNGTAAYHLTVLEREGYLRSALNGKRRLFWVKEEFPGSLEAGIPPVQRELLDLLEEYGQLSRKEIREVLDISGSTLHYNIKQLVEEGMVWEEREGREKICSLR